ncbi:phenylalanine--tRNA ligase subunit beta, partial [Xanthomonas citri pv. citri]|nr:phenylalanine--tRNA ligase subunit beta [Xanthomonas citri pv. citri]
SGVDATRPTPPWLAARLRLAGIRTISLPVDISNYVMWELGQPLHFYDADTLSGEIVVRRARAGETLTTLDGKERELDPEDLLIADDSGPIGL